MNAIEQAQRDLETIERVRYDDPELASSLERGLATSALMATVYGDMSRAVELAKIALAAQEIKFRRM
jgi:hypothetical protein